MLSYRISRGTPPKYSKACSWQASRVSNFSLLTNSTKLVRDQLSRYKSRERMLAASKYDPVTLHLLTGGGLKPDQWRFRTNDTQAPDELTHARHSPFIAQ